jgi:hypothetical protein
MSTRCKSLIIYRHKYVAILRTFYTEDKCDWLRVATGLRIGKIVKEEDKKKTHKNTQYGKIDFFLQYCTNFYQFELDYSCTVLESASDCSHPLAPT